VTYCSRCGVEVGERVDTCPLCEAPIQRLEAPEAPPARYPEMPPAPNRPLRYAVWVLATAILLSVALSSLTLDVLLNGRITWSGYPLTGAGVAWVLITLIVTLARRPVFVIVGQAAATAGFLFVIDAFDGSIDWFTPLALPVVAVVTGATLLVWLVARRSRKRTPSLIAATVLLACGAGSLALDLLVSGYRGDTSLTWSLVVLGAVGPPMLFLLYYHARLGRSANLRRILHR
jgi:hypothetical protein